MSREVIRLGNPETGNDTDNENNREWTRIKTRKGWEEARTKEKKGEEKFLMRRKCLYAMVVKMKTLSYTKALKTIMEKVDPDKLGITVAGIRETRGGGK